MKSFFELIIGVQLENLSRGSGAEDLFGSPFDRVSKVCYQDLDESNRTKSDSEIFLSQRAREQTQPQGTCEHTSGQCDFSIHCQESAHEIQIRRSFLLGRGAAWKTSDSLGPVRQRFLKKVPFASAQVRAGHFSVDRATIKSILDRELGSRKFTRKCVP
jgi:hypothetical protein